MKVVAGALLAFAVLIAWESSPLIAQQQQMKIPDEFFNQRAPYRVAVDDGTQAAILRKQSPATPLAGVATVGKMWNAFTSLNRNTNQIAYDPSSNTLVALYRRAFADRQSNRSGELTLNTSFDLGKTWNGESSTLNIGVENDAGQLTARHPTVVLSNPSKSSDRGQLNVTSIWSNLKGTGGFGQVGFASGILGGTYTKGKWGPSPPDFSIASNPAVNQINGNLYTVIEGVDPSTGNGIGEYYLATSNDQGKTWTIGTNSPILSEPVNVSQSLFNPTIDISPDGTTLYVSFAAITVTGGQYTIADPQHRIGFVRSTNGGATWSAPETIPLTAFNLVNVDFDKLTGYICANTAVAIDAQNTPHFLVTIQSDAFFPLDSTFVGEVTPNGGGWDFFGLAYVNMPWVFRFYASQRVLNYNEHEWAKSSDGNKLWAKWIDTDSSLAQLPGGLFTRDSLHNVCMSAKDIRSVGETRGWNFPRVKVTETPTVDEKMTKIAPLASDNGDVFIIYTILAEGDFSPDEDDLGESTLYMVTDARILPLVDAESPGSPADFALGQNYPNPFNPSTSIQYSVPTSGNVKLKVYNLLGKEITTLVNGFVEAGSHTVSFNALNLSSGLYTYRLEAGKNVMTRVMTLLK